MTVEIGDARIRSLEERQAVVNAIFEWWVRSPDCMKGSTLVVRYGGVMIFRSPQ